MRGQRGATLFRNIVTNVTFSTLAGVRHTIKESAAVTGSPGKF